MDAFLQNARIWRCTRNLAAKLAAEPDCALAEVACHAARYLQELLRRDLSTEAVFDHAPRTPRADAMRVYGLLEIDPLKARADGRGDRGIGGIGLWMATAGVAVRPAGLADVLRLWARIARSGRSPLAAVAGTWTSCWAPRSRTSLLASSRLCAAVRVARRSELEPNGSLKDILMRHRLPVIVGALRSTPSSKPQQLRAIPLESPSRSSPALQACSAIQTAEALSGSGSRQNLIALCQPKSPPTVATRADSSRAQLLVGTQRAPARDLPAAQPARRASSAAAGALCARCSMR